MENTIKPQSSSNSSAAQMEIVPGYGQDIRRTFKLFWPIFLGQIATTAMSVADTVMSGIAGSVQLAGVAIGTSFYLPAVLFIVGMSLAIQPTVAQLRGSGHTELIARKMHLATVIILVTSVIIGIMVSLMPLIYRFMPDVDQEMVRVGQGYLIAVALGMPGFAMFNILRGYWEGLGNTLPSSVFGILALVLNVPLNYIFIFGKFGAPELGGIGCGVATTVAIYISVIFMLIYIKTSKFYARYRIYEHMFKITAKEVKEFLHFGFPLALSTTIEVTCFSLVAVLLSPFGPVVVASHTVAMNVSAIIFMIPMAIASATTIRVGEAMGAGHWLRAQRTAIGAIIMGLFFYVLCFIIVIAFHDPIIDMYTDDPEVFVLGSTLLLYCAAFLLPDSLQVIGIGILRGFKDSRTIFIITIVAYWIVGMPVGYTLGYGLTGEPMAAQGFWIGFICALTVACLLYLARTFYLFRTRKLPKTFVLSSSDVMDEVRDEVMKSNEQAERDFLAQSGHQASADANMIASSQYATGSASSAAATAAQAADNGSQSYEQSGR